MASATVTCADATPRYHNGATLVCADCHVQHEVTPGAAGSGGTPGDAASAPAAMLLKFADPLDVCLSCHDGSTMAPDVVGSDTNGLAERAGGFFAEPGVMNPRGHDLRRGLVSDASALCARCHGGASTDQAVTCIDCHDPHGNGRARNLRWASAPQRTPELGLFVDPGARGFERYESRRVSYGTLDSDALREVTSMCVDCHHSFSGTQRVGPGADGIHTRHPAYDSERGSTNNIAQGRNDGGSSPEHWMAGTGSGFETPRVRFVARGASDYEAATQVNAGRNGVFCLSCHRAHGSGMAFGLAWPVGSAGCAAPGCDQCHAVAAIGLLPARMQ